MQKMCALGCWSLELEECNVSNVGWFSTEFAGYRDIAEKFCASEYLLCAC